MPRLTDAAYLEQRSLLEGEWDHRDGHFARLTITEQFILHRYFRPSEHLTVEAALAHRRQITAAEPSLPQQAGKAYVKFCDALTAPRPVPISVPHAKRKGSKREYVVGVRGLVRPDIDFEKLARAFIAHAKQQREKENLTHPEPDDQAERQRRGRS